MMAQPLNAAERAEVNALLCPQDSAAKICSRPSSVQPELVRGQKLSGRPVTGRQLMVLRIIYDSLATRGMPPTLRDVASAMGITSTNGVNDHLKALERKGLLVRSTLLSRSLRITVEGLHVLGYGRGENQDVTPVVDAAVASAPSSRLDLEVAALRRESSRLRILLDRVLRASMADFPAVLADIRKEMGA